ncbi:DinB family protein [Gimesia algae]|uniref:Metal-dependent hydrolase YfiT n=1 Tax=Gimesia algae TaxID=2527971 RepID=A0A517VI00_9PLAN|nr:DinB family protein [Gimesia algae]QDT92597.1 Putative metal-dependent hydrolase YfiT [Gimesia algae]
MKISTRIEEYLAGPEALRCAIEGMSAADLDAAPIPGKWSTRQVVCHIADFQPVYADRMKWIIAEDHPPLPGADHNLFAKRLAYDQRDMDEELQLIAVVRQNMARILKTLSEEQLQRTGLHSHDGEVSVASLLERITHHIPHHIKMIQEKRDALQV